MLAERPVLALEAQVAQLGVQPAARHVPFGEGRRVRGAHARPLLAARFARRGGGGGEQLARAAHAVPGRGGAEGVVEQREVQLLAVGVQRAAELARGKRGVGYRRLQRERGRVAPAPRRAKVVAGGARRCRGMVVDVVDVKLGARHADWVGVVVKLLPGAREQLPRQREVHEVADVAL